MEFTSYALSRVLGRARARVCVFCAVCPVNNNNLCGRDIYRLIANSPIAI